MEEYIRLIKFLDEKGYFYEGDKPDMKLIGLLSLVKRNPQDKRYKKMLSDVIETKKLLSSLVNDPFTPYPFARDFTGEMRLGLVGIHDSYSREEFDIEGINKPTIATVASSAFCKHFLNIGPTGCGKSVTLFGIQDEFLRIGKNYVSLGFKRDGRHRIRQIIKLLVLRINQNANFGWNITIPPKGVDQKDWDLTWARVFCETQSLSLGIESMLLEFVKKLRKDNDVITIEMIYREIEQAKFKAFRDTNWKASLLNRLEALCRFNKMLQTSRPFPLEKITEHYPIEFELDDAGEFKSMFATLIPIHLYKYRIVNNLRGNELWLAVFCDEGLFIGSREIQRSCFLGEPMLFNLIRLAREFGIGFVIATGEITSISDTIKNHCAMQLFMGANRFAETLEFGKNRNMTKEQLEFSTTKLSPGQGIMKMGNLPLFPITFPNLEIKKNVTDLETDEHNARLLQGTEFEYVINPGPINIVVDKPKEEGLKPDERAFLFDLYNRPYLNKQERIESISL